MDRTLTSGTTPCQSGPGRNDNEEGLCIPQNSSITGTSPSDCLMPYPGYSLWGVLPLWINAVGVFYDNSWSSKEEKRFTFILRHNKTFTFSSFIFFCFFQLNSRIIRSLSNLLIKLCWNQHSGSVNGGDW